MKIKSLILALVLMFSFSAAFAAIQAGLTGAALEQAVAAEVQAQKAANPALTDDQLAAIVMGQLQAAGYPLGVAVAAARSSGISSDAVNNAAAVSFGVTPADAAAAGDQAAAGTTGSGTTSGPGTGSGTGTGSGGGGTASGG